jgi:hypothetical protein
MPTYDVIGLSLNVETASIRSKKEEPDVVYGIKLYTDVQSPTSRSLNAHFHFRILVFVNVHFHEHEHYHELIWKTNL